MGAMDIIFKLIFGSKSQNDEKILKPIAEKTLSFEEGIKKLSNEELTNKTKEFRERVEKYIGCKTEDFDLTNEENKKKLQNILDEILPEAFAVVREASVRTTGMRHFDVQVMGGAVLHQGRIAEMKTGEGKTLVATLSVYLNALTGLGVHVVTVNNYLAKRDAEWMMPIYSMLGISVGILDDTKPHSPERREVYSRDVVYGTNNEFGFDYLRDNMVIRKEDKVQRKFYYAIVDEVDSILIDEARTPLIISGPAEKNIKMYYEIDRIIPMLKQAETDERMREVAGTGDYVLDEKDKNVYLTEDGVHKVEKLLNVENLYGAQSSTIVHHVNQALKAHKVFKRDVDYMVTDGQVLIVDEFTGRVLEGRRYSDGLHQAIEAKEKVAIQNESQTYATITFQNYFRMYPKLSGMTGTAETEAEEFYKIYKLDVAVIPTNKPVTREDLSDKIYRTKKAKFEALAKYIKTLQDEGKPVLVGTVSVEMNEELSKIFKRYKISHEVLNAKNHSREASIIAQAGEPGAVTLATNMAGRGTDIVLGGNPVAKGVSEIEQILTLMRDRAFKERDPYKKEELLKKIKSIDLYKEAFVRLVISGKNEEAKEIAERITFPVLVRPSYVIGGRAMEIVYDNNELEEYMKEAVKVSPEHPILVDKFLEDAIELDVDVLCDGEEVFIAGIMEHIEEAGVHSGDSACVIPPQTIPEHILNTIREYSTKLALELDVKGLMNIQYAVKLDEEMVYIIEANPRASRTVPFVSKAIGVPLAKVATWIMTGAKLKDFNLTKEIKIDHVAVKESVFPFLKLPESDTVLGPEMKSTGESIGIDENFGMAFYKSQLAAGMDLPKEGKIFISVKEQDKKKIRPIAEKAANLGFELVATNGTADAAKGVDIEKIKKVSQGSPNIRDAILNKEINLIINTSEGKQSAKDGYIIRRLAIELGIPYVTTLSGARAALNAIEAVQNNEINVKSLNEHIDGE